MIRFLRRHDLIVGYVTAVSSVIVALEVLHPW